MKTFLYNIYQILVLCPVIFLASAWAGTTMAVMCPLTGKYGDWWGSFASRWWARIIMTASLIPVKVAGRENISKDTSYVFVANHQGAYDIFLVCGYLGAEIRWMLKRSLEKIPFLGIGCKKAGYIYVDNGNPGAVRSTYRRAEKALEGGASLMVFPEGSRTKTGQMNHFKKGAFALADELQLPVVPMTINGSYDILPPWRDGKFIRRHPLSLTIHKPIYPQSKGEENIQRMMNESYNVIKGALLSLCLLVTAADAQNALTLHYDRPAEYFEESLVIGNGTIGAAVYGGMRQDKLSLNDITLWTGEGADSPADTHPTAAECAEALKKTRDLLGKEDYEGAERTYKAVEGPHSETYMPLGTLTITYLDKVNSRYTDYNRSLDISEALCTTSYKVNGCLRKTEYIASAPDSVIAIHISTDAPQGITALFGLTSKLPHKIHNMVSADGLVTVASQGYAAYHDEPDYYKLVDVHTLYDPERGTRFMTTLTVRNTGGTVKTTDTGEIKAEGCREITVYLTNATSFNGNMANPAKAGVDYEAISHDRNVSASRLSFDDIRNKQSKDYKRLFGRVSLNLGSTADSIKCLPTDKQLLRYCDNNERNPELEALYFQYGRYLLISCSRTDGVPANLQGLWTESVTPPWSCNYTTNINLEENYWPAEVTNLTEMHRPLLGFIKRMAVTGEKTAKQYYGVNRGWCAGHNTDIWAMTNPVGRGVGDTSWATWNMGGAWLSTHLWEHYMFTLDKDFLREYFPVLKGAAEFCLGWMTEKNGELITMPCTSPENQYVSSDGFIGSTFYGGAADMAFIRECLTNAIQAAEILGGQKNFKAEAENALAKLRPYKKNNNGGLLEWYHDWDDKDPHHRHQSHLFHIFPGHNAMGTEDMAMKTLEIKGDKTTGWSTGWRVCLNARLGDSEGAYHIYRKLLDYVSPMGYNGKDARHSGGTFPNLLDAHPPFQIDGNFGGCAGVAEMLLQSEYTGGKSVVKLLPALPSEWKDGEVKGLCARGGMTVDIEWKDGKLYSATIHNRSTDNGRSATIKYNGKATEIKLRPGGTTTIHK